MTEKGDGRVSVGRGFASRAFLHLHSFGEEKDLWGNHTEEIKSVYNHIFGAFWGRFRHGVAWDLGKHMHSIFSEKQKAKRRSAMNSIYTQRRQGLFTQQQPQTEISFIIRSRYTRIPINQSNFTLKYSYNSSSHLVL